MHISQSAINPVTAHGQPGVVEPELVQDGGVDVVDLGGVQTVERLVAPLTMGSGPPLMRF